MKRGTFALAVFLAAACLLCGCVKKYGRSEIASYAKKISARPHLTVSEGYKEIQEDEEGYLDHLWTVTDEDAGFEFHVLDDYYWAMEEVENQLLNDYDSAVFLYLLEAGKIPSENGISLKKTNYSGMVQAELSCSFTDLAGLEECYRELQTIREAAEKAGFPGLNVPYNVRYKNPLRGAVDYEIDEGDTTGELGSLDGETFSRMKKNYLTCALDYRFENALAEFTAEEIHAVVHSPESVRIYRKQASAGGAEDASQDRTRQASGSDTASAAQETEQASGSGTDSPAQETGQASASGTDASSSGDAAQPSASGEASPEEGSTRETGAEYYYEGVIGSPKYAGISFGTLFELLRQEGRHPKGNAWHFTCKGQDGAELEFSYAFNDLSGFNDAEGRLKKGYYYIRDGRKIRMSAYYANHFDASEIEALTGLNVAEYRPYVSGR